MIIFEIQRKYKASWFMVYYVGPIHICACPPYFRKSRIDNYTVDNIYRQVSSGELSTNIAEVKKFEGRQHLTHIFDVSTLRLP